MGDYKSSEVHGNSQIIRKMSDVYKQFLTNVKKLLKILIDLYFPLEVQKSLPCACLDQPLL